MADDEAPDRAVEELEGYGLEEGEVETMESKWVTWSFDVEENKGLVLDEVWAPPTPGELAGRSLLRARRRDYFGERVVGASPVFYGVVVAVLAPIAAMVVSPAQTFCVGVVLDRIQADELLTRERVSTMYAMALLISSPIIMLHSVALSFVSRRLFVGCAGLLFCAGLLLLAHTYGEVSLLLSWTLLQVTGPGVLYPMTETALLDWWSAKRAKVQALVHVGGAFLGMLVMPLLLELGSRCADCTALQGTASSGLCSCWRGAYTALGLLMLLPLALVGLLLVEGGAADYGLELDDAPRPAPMLPAPVFGEEEAAGGAAGGAEPTSSPHEDTRDAAAPAAGAPNGHSYNGHSSDAAGSSAAHAALAPAAEESTEASAEDAPAGSSAEAEQVTVGVRAERPRVAAPRRAPPLVRRRPLSSWTLTDVLSHTTFWLAQVSISTVHAILAAFLFHRSDLVVHVYVYGTGAPHPFDPGEANTVQAPTARTHLWPRGEAGRLMTLELMR